MLKISIKLSGENAGKKFWIVVIIGSIVSACIGAIVIPYIINTWLVYFGKQPIFKWYYGLILGLFPSFAELSIPLAIITWVLMMFLK